MKKDEIMAGILGFTLLLIILSVLIVGILGTGPLMVCDNPNEMIHLEHQTWWGEWRNYTIPCKCYSRQACEGDNYMECGCT